jgi:GNAT superfamily N-acetyltransferase
MNFVVEAIGSSSRLATSAAEIRAEVFQDAWTRILEGPRFQDVGRYLDLVARVESTGEPVGVMAVVETTGNTSLHASFGLPFRLDHPSARYTQLAVLKPYRGMDIPLRLIMEAKRRFVHPAGIRYTWLLFDGDRTSTSCFLCRGLGFQAGARTYRSEYGRVRVLSRDEMRPTASEADLIAQDYLSDLSGCRTSGFSTRAQPGVPAPLAIRYQLASIPAQGRAVL